MLSATLNDDPVALAMSAQELVGVPLSEQYRWSQVYDALNGWKAAFEGLGILVFQATGVSTKEMRGFSFAEWPFPAIILNVKDFPNPRVFTLAHELCHLLLRQDGMCDLTEGGPRPPEEDRTEVFCNAFAAEFLVPTSAFLESAVVGAHGPDQRWRDDEIASLARRFSVSREVVVRRLLTLGRTTETFYREKRNELAVEYERLSQDRKSGPVTPDIKAVSYAGQAFVHLVLVSYYGERITSSDVSNYSGVRLKHLGPIEERVMGRSVMFG